MVITCDKNRKEPSFLTKMLQQKESSDIDFIRSRWDYNAYEKLATTRAISELGQRELGKGPEEKRTRVLNYGEEKKRLAPYLSSSQGKKKDSSQEIIVDDSSDVELIRSRMDHNAYQKVVTARIMAELQRRHPEEWTKQSIVAERGEKDAKPELSSSLAVFFQCLSAFFASRSEKSKGE